MNKHIQNAMKRMKEGLSALHTKGEAGREEQTTSPTPNDEQLKVRHRRVWPYLTLNVLAAVVFGLSLYVLAQLQTEHLNDWSREGNTTRGFAYTFLDEARSLVNHTLISQSQAEFSQLPEDSPLPHTFGSWSAIRQLDYMATISTKSTPTEKLETAKTYIHENGKAEGDAYPQAPTIFYTKADLQKWMKEGIRTAPKDVELRFGKHTDFRFASSESPNSTSSASAHESYAQATEGVDKAPSVAPEEGEWSSKEEGEWTEDIIHQAKEVVKPLSADSLLAAAQGNLEWYRESLKQLEITLDSLKIDVRTRQYEEKPSNLEYTISILDGTKKFTNAMRSKSKTPAWSAPITVENGYCTVGTGLWNDTLINGVPPINVLLAQDESLNEPNMKVTLRVDTTMQEEDSLQLYLQTFPVAQKVSKLSVLAAIVSGVLWLVTLCVTLVRTTNAHIPFLRKIEGAIPLELVLMACVLFLWFVFAMAIELRNVLDGQAMPLLRDPMHNPYWLLLIPCLIVFDLVGWLLLSMLFRKARQGRFFRGSILWTIGQALHTLYRSYQEGKKAKHRVLVKVLLFYVGVCGTVFLYALLSWDLLWGLLLLTAAAVPIVFALRQDRDDARIISSMQRIADGDWHERLEEESFYGAHRRMASEINRFDQSLQHAVEKSLKNERMQTELITNVSHDLCTLLTSIINYVDLLRSPDATEEERAQYLEVLAKKAQRLKILMNDLIDVSKATSGAVQLNMEEIDYTEVVRQSLAEADSGWKKNALVPVVDLPEEPLYIEADGQKLSRVLENLFSNAQKYSQEGTRVYIQLQQQENQAVFTMKNTSRYELNIPAEELLERFNRSDKSRTTEGSGLGLSIAEQLAKRMGGSLTLDIDGDLFKASVAFPHHIRQK